jgi:three-Cys-motif partner protein
MSRKLTFDQIHYWSEIKLDIVKKYAVEYCKIFRSKKQEALSHIYIDAFAGAGVNISKTTGEFIPGSPLNALMINPPFREYHFIDIDGSKISSLKERVGDRSDVFVYEGDCNRILLENVFPRVRFEDFRRGLCLLDPYGLHLNWEVIKKAGEMGTIDLFLNFPIMDINRNALWRIPNLSVKSDIQRMNAFWGDESWRETAYRTKKTLWGFEEEKVNNEIIAEEFRRRLLNIANFKTVLKPMPMRNRNNAIVYYLFFASQKAVAKKLAKSIFKKYHHHRYSDV